MSKIRPWREEVLSFGPQRSQRGVWCRPVVGGDSAEATVIFINAGLIHHVGPNRLHVRLARALARQGLASLRLDLSGIGDSGSRADRLSIFEIVRREPAEAMDALAAQGCSRFALVGICSGAYSSFHVACADPRVAAAVVINPEDLLVGGAPGAEAWARRYWTRSILRPRAWINLLSGRTNYRRLVEVLRQRFGKPADKSAVGPHPLLVELGDALAARPLRMLFLTCDDDVSTDYLRSLLRGPVWQGLPAGAATHEVVTQCDHLFTRLQDQQRLESLLLPWLEARLQGRPAAMSSM